MDSAELKISLGNLSFLNFRKFIEVLNKDKTNEIKNIVQFNLNNSNSKFKTAKIFKNEFINKSSLGISGE